MSQTNHYKQIFSQYSGYVYQFIDTIPEGESPQEYITNEFVAKAKQLNSATSVTQLPNNGAYILHSFEDVTSEQFIRLADLGYQEPLLEVEAEPEVEADPEAEPQGDN
jgi:hypothetical protein